MTVDRCRAFDLFASVEAHLSDCVLMVRPLAGEGAAAVCGPGRPWHRPGPPGRLSGPAVARHHAYRRSHLSTRLLSRYCMLSNRLCSFQTGCAVFPTGGAVFSNRSCNFATDTAVLKQIFKFCNRYCNRL
jgi:hypothetical protein